MGEKRTYFPGRNTLGYSLLELAAICGELPAGLVCRIPGSGSYKETVLCSLRKGGLLRTYYQDRLRGYRLGRKAKGYLLADCPGRFGFYLTGKTDTNRLKCEVSRRVRLHRIAEVYVAMMNAGVAVFRDEKPAVFVGSRVQAPGMERAAFYSSREVKEMGVETVKIRGSRMAGVLLATSGAFIIITPGPMRQSWITGPNRGRRCCSRWCSPVRAFRHCRGTAVFQECCLLTVWGISATSLRKLTAVTDAFSCWTGIMSISIILPMTIMAMCC